MKNKLFRNIMDLIFIFSVPFLTLLMCGNYSVKKIAIVFILSFFTGVFIKYFLWKEKIYECFNKKYFIIATISSCYANGLLMKYCDGGANFVCAVLKQFLGINLANNKVVYVIATLAIFSMIWFVYYFILKLTPFIKCEYKKFTKNEKYFLAISFIVGLLLTTGLYTLTDAFHAPHHNGNLVFYDVIYTTDSGAITMGDAYLNIGMPENDLRQPLFGLLSMPFAVIANFISIFFKFIPGSYYIIFNTIQILLISLSFVMLAKLLNLSEKQKIYFWVLAFSSFSVIIFSFLAEQYVFALFYLILALYIGCNHFFEVNYAYIASVGTLLTSGVIFPLISRFKNFKSWFINVFKCFIGFMIFMILSGQLLQFFTVFAQINKFMGWSGQNILFIDKFYQFLNFVSSIFIAPLGKVITQDGIPLYHLNEVNSVNFLGVIILVICVVSFIMNRKNKMAQLSFLWILFSFALLCLLGWGTQENGLILYALYFAWAFIILIYLMIEKLFKNELTKYRVISILCVIMLVINSLELYRIIEFGIKYYS